jgi:chromosome segregation ATPase
MMSDRDDKIIQLRDDLKARENQLKSLKNHMVEEQDAKSAMEEKILKLMDESRDLLAENQEKSEVVKKLGSDLKKREDQIENLQVLVAENNELQEGLKILKEENEKFRIGETDSKDQVEAKESQLQVMKEGLAHLEEIKMKNADLEDKLRRVF